MPDILTPIQRHVCMSHIKGKDTSPEMVVRRFLHAEGFRYSLHKASLPGKPDIVLRRFKAVVLVNGCFWHGHEGCKYYVLPKTNADFWRHKIELNQARDYRERVELELLGWHVLVVWECELKSDKRDAMLQRLKDELFNLAQPIKPIIRHYPTEDEEPLLQVAEDEK